MMLTAIFYFLTLPRYVDSKIITHDLFTVVNRETTSMHSVSNVCLSRIYEELPINHNDFCGRETMQDSLIGLTAIAFKTVNIYLQFIFDKY